MRGIAASASHRPGAVLLPDRQPFSSMGADGNGLLPAGRRRVASSPCGMHVIRLMRRRFILGNFHHRLTCSRKLARDSKDSIERTIP